MKTGITVRVDFKVFRPGKADCTPCRGMIATADVAGELDELVPFVAEMVEQIKHEAAIEIVTAADSMKKSRKKKVLKSVG